ncbi:MAG TPA: protein tyrosine phosphatase, partial [Ancylobacter sp.]
MDVKRLVSDEAVQVFDSLAQPTRLDAYRLLLRYVPFGLPAGDIARLLAVPH